VRWWSQAGLSDSVRFRWDSLGRRDTLLYSNGARALFMYDEDGALRVLCGAHPDGTSYPTANVFQFAVVHDWVDGDGLIRRTSTANPGITGCGGTDFHIVHPAHDNSYDARHQLTRQLAGPTDWTYAYDGSGNRVEHLQNGERWTYGFAAHSNRLAAKQHDAGSLCVFGGCTALGSWFEYTHHPDGSRAVERPCEPGTGCEDDEPGYRLYRYDGLGRTRATFEAACGAWNPDTQECQSGGAWSTVTCAYDPLNRLVMPCENGGPPLGYDGENVVRTKPTASANFWTFVHAPGVDDPILGRYTQNASSGTSYFFVTDGRGRQYAVGHASGADASGDNEYVAHGGTYSGAGEVATSFGTQRLPSTSQPGLAFFRHRFYDQQTGRWTQEDPLGVAGGVNLYGFVGNNPAAFTDPFGLRPTVVDTPPVGGEQAEGNRQFAVGAQGLIGGGPIAGLFLGGGLNVGVNDDSQFFIQFQVSGGVGFGAFGGVGVQAGVDQVEGDLPSGLSVASSSQITANVGLIEAVGGSANFNNSAQATGGSVAPPTPRAGVGLGAQASIQRVRTVTIATRPIAWLRRLFNE
jgi:RHS repeat-associated protein